MKLPSNYFDNLSASKYKQYLKLLPDMQKENTRLITTLILTFLALIFFGIFAINPTLTTIIELHKQLEDSQFTHEQLTTKINNLSILQQKYTLLQPELPVIENAIPREALATKITGQIHTLAKDHKLSVHNLRVSEVVLTGKTPAPKGLSYVFNLEVTGNYENMISFVGDLTHFDRIVTIETIATSRDSRTEELVMSIRGRQYFKP
jgi:Tfp pilus assembly protein PilO